MANEVVIIVKAKNETKLVFDAVRKDAEKLGADIGKTVNEHVSKSISQNSNTTAGAAPRDAGDRIGNTIGQRIRDRITDNVKQAFNRIKIERDKIDVDVHERGSSSGGTNKTSGDRDRVRVSVDVDKRGFMERFSDLASNAGETLRSALTTGVTSVFSGDVISLVIKSVAVAMVAGVSAPIVGGAIASTVLLALGGGVIALGIAGAFKDPRIQAAAGELKTKLGSMFERFGEPFRGPLAKFMEDFTKFLEKSQPLFDKIAQTFAPVLGALGDGLIGMLQNMLPGLTDGIIAAAPFFEMLAKHLPEIGQRLGDFFREIGQHGPQATQFFSDLLSLVEKLIGLISMLVGAFLNFYGNVRKLAKAILAPFIVMKYELGRLFRDMWDLAKWAIEQIVNGFKGAKGKISGVFSSILATIVHVVNRIGGQIDKVQGFINGIRGKTVTISVRQVFENVGHIIGNIVSKVAGQAHGGITGAASGGIHSGLRLVGEAGPELAELPPGTRVHPTGQTQRMLAGSQGGGGGVLEVRPMRGADSELVSVLLKALRYEIRRGGGNVQSFLGGVSA
jgi:hypothetical protein